VTGSRSRDEEEMGDRWECAKMKDESWRRRKKEKSCSTFLATGVECVEYL
jgi:hypothetical protein